MFVLNREQKQIVFKRNIASLGMGVFLEILAAVVFCFFCRIWSEEEQSSFMDYFGFAFLCLWLTFVVIGGIYCFVNGSKKVTIDAQGIFCRSWFEKMFIPWLEVADWGLSYSGQTKGEGNTYEVYFAKHLCETKNDCRKRLKGKMIKTFIYEKEYQTVVDQMVPFCKEYTTVEPFVAVDKFHFLF